MWQPEVRLTHAHPSHLHVLPSPYSTPHSRNVAVRGPAETDPPLTLTCASFPPTLPLTADIWQREVQLREGHHSHLTCFLPPTVPLTADMWQPEVQLRQIHSSCHLRGTFDLAPQKFNFSQFTLRLHLKVRRRYVRFSKTVNIEVSSKFTSHISVCVVIKI